jgi:lambda family phage portal protein
VLHVYRPLAPGQVRGIPWLAPCLLTLHDLDGLTDALLVGARVAAMHAGLLVDMNGVGSGVPFDGQQLGSVLESGLEPGTLRVLPAGFDVKFSTPQAATSAIELAKLNLRAVAMGAGLPEHVLSGDLASANFSSLRAGLTEWRTRVEQLQFQILVPQLLRPVWERWIELESLAGTLPEVTPDLLRAEWYPPAMPWVDPLKDAEAEAALIAAGLKSRRQSVAAQGFDIETLDAEIASDRAREAALGLSFSAPAPKPGTPP